MEKKAYTVVCATRKLRPYFLAHCIVVVTADPLRKVLHSPIAAGRLISWAIELSEFDIDYVPQKTIRA